MNLSQCAFAFGAWSGLFRTRRPASAQAGVEGVSELAAAVTEQELMTLGLHVAVHEDVAGGLGGPWTGGVGGDAEQVGATGAVSEQDQCVDALEIDGVDVEESTAMMCSA
jgi:hypothetical protein